MIKHSLPLITTTEYKNTLNTYPVILVHGFRGWGRDEALGFKYWGGFRDLETELKNKGYKIYTASIGPISSNWDRACELYAYIKGGQVDYGEKHSKEHGHNRFGRIYPGIYKDWGERDNNGKIKKVHLIGHSMGGQTIRVLDQLLAKGSKSERSYSHYSMSSLFSGKKHWICSVSTISAPHDGTTLADSNYLLAYAKELTAYLGTLSGNMLNHLLDFKLEHWGLKRESGESAVKYIHRVLESPLWENNRDIAAYDLTTEGAKELNKWVHTQADVYYFAYSTKATRNNYLTGNVVFDSRMNPFFLLFSNKMIYYRRNDPIKVIIGKNWAHNDGIVNVIIQNGPKEGSNDKIVKFNGQSKKGIWHDMPMLNNMDHGDIINIFNTFGNDILPWYTNLMEHLISLPE